MTDLNYILAFLAIALACAAVALPKFWQRAACAVFAVAVILVGINRMNQIKSKAEKMLFLAYTASPTERILNLTQEQIRLQEYPEALHTVSYACSNWHKVTHWRRGYTVEALCKEIDKE